MPLSLCNIHFRPACTQVPLAMDCTDSHILIASAPLELLVLQLQGGGGVLAGSSALGTTAASSAADGSGSGGGAAAGGGGRPPSAPGKGAKLVAVRELSLFNVGRPVQDVSLVSVAAAEMAHKALRGTLVGWRGDGFEFCVADRDACAHGSSLTCPFMSLRQCMFECADVPAFRMCISSPHCRPVEGCWQQQQWSRTAWCRERCWGHDWRPSVAAALCCAAALGRHAECAGPVERR